ncbi:MAG: hypothetical protein KatS3mg105_1647 [Gemmatales bacterium]|nr:MAG: hypothetical protein KatS3mg105_1647 [Gemmatales bacterium]
MDGEGKRTRFAFLSRRQSAAVLVLTLLAVGWSLFVAATQPTLIKKQQEHRRTGQRRSDADFYKTIVERVGAGENYYAALAEEFSEWDEPAASIFNWRLPLYAWFFGKLPDPRWGQVILAILPLTAVVLAFKVAERDLGAPATFFTLFLAGPFAWLAFEGICLFTELWAGILITLSVLSYALDRPWPGVGTGLAALFVRELVLPYCLLCLVFAFVGKKRREVLVWLIGFACFAAFYIWHAHQVAGHRAAPGGFQPGGWVRFGGWAFIIGTSRMGNIFLIDQPMLAAGLLPLSLLGLVSWPGVLGERGSLTCLGYMSAFTIVGQPYNAYWGLLYSPLLALGLAAAPSAIRDLFHGLRAGDKNPSSS